MDTLNDIMIDLLIDQDGRLEESRIFVNRAYKAEQIVLNSTDREVTTHASKN